MKVTVNAKDLLHCPYCGSIKLISIKHKIYSHKCQCCGTRFHIIKKIVEGKDLISLPLLDTL